MMQDTIARIEARLNRAEKMSDETRRDLLALLEELKAACAAQGRDYGSVEITSMWDNKGGMDAIRAFEDIGVSRVIVPLFMLGRDPVAGLNKLADDIIAKLA